MNEFLCVILGASLLWNVLITTVYYAKFKEDKEESD